MIRFWQLRKEKRKKNKEDGNKGSISNSLDVSLSQDQWPQEDKKEPSPTLL